MPPEKRLMRPALFEDHAGLGACKKPKHSVKLMAGIRLAGSPNVRPSPLAACTTSVHCYLDPPPPGHP